MYVVKCHGHYNELFIRETNHPLAKHNTELPHQAMTLQSVYICTPVVTFSILMLIHPMIDVHILDSEES